MVALPGLKSKILSDSNNAITPLKALHSFFCLDTKERIKEKIKALFYPLLRNFLFPEKGYRSGDLRGKPGASASA